MDAAWFGGEVDEDTASLGYESGELQDAGPGEAGTAVEYRAVDQLADV